MKYVVVFVITLAIWMALATDIHAQPSAIIRVVGVSARQAAADTTDIFTASTSGLPSIGVGEVIYLSGNPADTAITAWSWSLSARPPHSNAALSASDQAVISLLTDLAGTYCVTLRVTSATGQSTPVEIPINSANWVGVGGISSEAITPQCAACHGGQIDDMAREWNETKHAHMLESMIGGTRGIYRPTCVRCHAVGYDTDSAAVNHGFDDVARSEEWQFPVDPTSQNDTTWDGMIRHYPQTAAMANIQCENCHGPGSAHLGNVTDNRIVKSLDAEVCARCHDANDNNYRAMQWGLSGHSRPPVEDLPACVRCHSGYGFLDQLNAVPDSLKNLTREPITCAVCHDPHEASNPHELRTVAAYTLENGVEMDIGNGNLCLNCHHSLHDAATYILERPSGSFGPHNSPQGDMLAGTNGIEYGLHFQSTPHAARVENGCVGCHMAATPEDVRNSATFLKLGDHTFRMRTETGEEHVEACTQCHGAIESFEAIKADSDWDGNGEVSSVQVEIQGMMNQLAMLLPPVGEPTIHIDSTFSLAMKQAAYNYFFVLNDGSKGMHNPGYAHGILAASLADHDHLGVEKTGETVPATYSLSEAYPNPFNSVATFNYGLAKESSVDIRVFDVAGRRVTTVTSGEYKAGSYRTAVYMTGHPSGVYILRMKAGNFDASRELNLVK